jgi:hypothetical protein
VILGILNGIPPESLWRRSAVDVIGPLWNSLIFAEFGRKRFDILWGSSRNGFAVIITQTR